MNKHIGYEGMMLKKLECTCFERFHIFEIIRNGKKKGSNNFSDFIALKTEKGIMNFNLKEDSFIIDDYEYSIFSRDNTRCTKSLEKELQKMN